MAKAVLEYVPPASLHASWGLADTLHQRYLDLKGIPVQYDIRPYLQRLRAIDAVAVSQLPDSGLEEYARGLRDRGRAGEAREALLAEVFALAREVAGRRLSMRPFDVQVAAGVALDEGRVAQLATGEGKTLVAVLPATLSALGGRGVHILTANDYLARRDAAWMAPVYRAFGLDVASVVEGMTHDERRRAYAADVTYVTAREAGFDFLRDHTAPEPGRVVQRPYHFVIIDEADFILIDEARVPLVIAGTAPALAVDHRALAQVARALEPGVDYDTDEYQRTVVLTDRGFDRAGRLLGGVILTHPNQHTLLSALHVALHAERLLRRDRDYIVRGGRVELVDEFTGRVADRRRWPHGIQPAVEAKEGVEIREEGRILGSIPIQHFVKLYPRLAGMTATAVPAAEEFETFFGLRTVAFPPNRPCQRLDDDDVVFSHRAAKQTALLGEIERVHGEGRPILVGTASVAESEDLAAALAARATACEVLNARHDALEAGIIAGAGAPGAVTISTNMAGRGTDIALGGKDSAARDRVSALGGLDVIGTNRHESRRIDDQLRGRAGRQGDPGSSRFFVSLEDDLIQRYGVLTLVPRAHRPRRQPGPLSDPVVAREIARAQRIIEGQNFEIRKTLWRYSLMVDEQRRIVYERRQAYLLDLAEPGVCRQAAPRHYQELAGVAGEAAVRRAEQLVAMHLLDRGWSEHLALIEDIREGIHLQRYGGREPLTEFQRQIIDAFNAMMKRVDEDTVLLFKRLRADGTSIDLARVGLGGSTSTWTYLVNDNPFSPLMASLLASRTLTSAVGILGVVYWPVTVVISAGVFLRRWLGRRAQAGDRGGDDQGEDQATREN